MIYPIWFCLKIGYTPNYSNLIANGDISHDPSLMGAGSGRGGATLRGAAGSSAEGQGVGGGRFGWMEKWMVIWRCNHFLWENHHVLMIINHSYMGVSENGVYSQ